MKSSSKTCTTFKDSCLLLLTQQMSRDGSLQVDVLRTIFFVQSSTNISMHVLIKRLQLLPQGLQVFFKGRGLIQGAPESSIIRVT